MVYNRKEISDDVKSFPRDEAMRILGYELGLGHLVQGIHAPKLIPRILTQLKDLLKDAPTTAEDGANLMYGYMRAERGEIYEK